HDQHVVLCSSTAEPVRCSVSRISMIDQVRGCLKHLTRPMVAGAMNERLWSTPSRRPLSIALCMLGLVACLPPLKALADPDADTPPADAPRCFGTWPVQICLESPPKGLLDLPDPINIDSDSTCTTVTRDNYCVFAGTKITVTGSVRATGTRPLVL